MSQDLEKKSERIRKSTIITGFIGIITAIISILIGIFQINYLGNIEVKVLTLTPTPIIFLTPSAQDINTRVSDIDKELKSLRQEVAIIKQNISLENPDTDTITLQLELKDIDNRISIIEKYVLDNPDKALELTMLNSEIDNLKTNYEKDLERTRKEIDRIYDFNKWFIALMFTMALGLISISISNFMKKPEQHKESTQNKKNTSVSKAN